MEFFKKHQKTILIVLVIAIVIWYFFLRKKKAVSVPVDPKKEGESNYKNWVKCGDNAQGHWFQFAPCPESKPKNAEYYPEYLESVSKPSVSVPHR